MPQVRLSRRIPESQAKPPLSTRLEDAQTPVLDLRVSNPTVTGLAPRLSEFKTQMRSALEYASDAYLTLSNFAQATLPSLLIHKKEIQTPVVERIQENLKYLLSSSAHSAISVLPVEGAWYAIIALPPIHTDLEWATKILEEEEVRVHPGFLFDIHSEGMLVLSLLTRPDQFHEGISRILQLVERAL